MDLSIILPALNEAGNLPGLLEQLQRALSKLTPNFEILVVDGGSSDETTEVAKRFGVDCWIQTRPGLTRAIFEGFSRVRGAYVLTMDGDHSHDPIYIERLWADRENADVVIASRYVPGGKAEMPFSRWLLSRLLNGTFRAMLSLPVHDLSSNFRLYRAAALEGIACEASHYDGLLEILVRIQAGGGSIREVPFTYKPRLHGSSKARIAKFAWPTSRPWSTCGVFAAPLPQRTRERGQDARPTCIGETRFPPSGRPGILPGWNLGGGGGLPLTSPLTPRHAGFLLK